MQPNRVKTDNIALKPDCLEDDIIGNCCFYRSFGIVLHLQLTLNEWIQYDYYTGD